jgi:hypothetical protein
MLNLHKITFYLLLVISSISTIKKNKAEDFLENVDVEIDETYFNNDFFEEMTYDKYIEDQKTIISRPQLVKAHQLEKRFPELVPAQCGDGPCKTIMYEMINHNKSNAEVEKLPTILLVAGVHGNETLGINSLVQLIRMAQKLYLYKTQWYRLLNNTRILVIPALNMNGFMNEELEETVHVNNAEYKIDPKYDFNLSPESNCYVSFSAQVIAKIFDEYPIYGSFMITKGEHKIRFPKMERVMGTATKDPDAELLVEIVNNLTNSFNFNHDLDIIPQAVSNKKVDQRFIGNNKFGTFIEWAYGSSENNKFLNNNCFLKGQSFSKYYKPPNENSHRAIAFELNLDKNEVKNYTSEDLGNEVYIFDRDNEEGDSGIIPATVLMLQRFLEYLSPSTSLKHIKIEDDLKDFPNDIQYTFNFDLYGCHFMSNSKLVYPETENQTSTFETMKYTTTPTYITMITVRLPKEGSINHYTTNDFEFEFDCDSDLKHLRKSKEKMRTHFFRSRFDDEYKIQFSKIFLQPMKIKRYQVKNIRKNYLNTGLIVEISPKNTYLIYDRFYLIQIGRYFPIKISYNKEKTQLELMVNEFYKSDDEFSKSGFENFTFQTGILDNISNSEHNMVFLKLLMKLFNSGDDLEFTFYNAFMNYLCNQYQTDFLIEKNMEINKLIEENTNNLLKLKKESDINNKVASEIVKLENEINRLQNNQKINKCNQYYGESSKKNMESSAFYKISKMKSVKVLPMMFYRLLGRNVSINFTAKESNNKNKTPLEPKQKQEETPEVYQLNGTVVLEDPGITNFKKENTKEDFIPAMQVTHLSGNRLQYYAYDTLMCSSLSPFTVVTSDLLRDSLQQSKTSEKTPKFYNQNKEDFFTVHIKANTREDFKGTIRVYTNLKTSGSHLTLYNKKKEFQLELTDIKLDLPNDYDGSNLKVYSGDFPNEDLKLLGLYVLVYDQNGLYPIFDCFLGRDKSNYNIKTQFILYDSIIQETFGVLNNESVLSKDKSEEFNNDLFFLICWVFFAIFAICIMGGIIYSWKIGLLNMGKKDELEDPLENEKELENENENKKEIKLDQSENN